MSMITCRECGADISDLAETCPYCGAPVQDKIKDSNPLVTCRTHWACCIRPAIIGLIFFVIGFLIARFTDNNISFIGVIICVIAVIAAFWAAFVRKHKTLILSKRMIVGRTGVIRTKNISAPLDKVQDITIENGLGGKIFHYHTVRIATAGTGTDEYVYKLMTHAKDFREVYLTLI